MQRLVITRPDDWHIHLRAGASLERTVADASRYFGRVIVMPNLVPPCATTADAVIYRDHIVAHAKTPHFQPLMTLYLTDSTQPEEIRTAKTSGLVHAVKLYPAGATTNSHSGVTHIENVYSVLEVMQEVGMPLLLHGEVTHADIDIFDREKIFLEKILAPLMQRFPRLRIVLEHITTADAAHFVRDGNHLAATITAHHLLYNRNHMLVGGIRPHFYCLPILKRNTHQTALIEAAISGNPKFFLGTDSAPHAQHTKEAACGCAGCYTAHAAIELYAEAFEQAGALDKLEGFASFYGSDFYQLPRNKDTITLEKNSWVAPVSLAFGETQLVPLRAGERIEWRVTHV